MLKKIYCKENYLENEVMVALCPGTEIFFLKLFRDRD